MARCGVGVQGVAGAACRGLDLERTRESPRFRQAVQNGIDAASQWEGLHEQDPKRLASSFEQKIRVAIVEAVKSEH
ncbi:MAG: hypothetical protein ABR915_08935 [Thermoguttaceae bacterium]|jgi:hypothetical protein